MVTSTNTPNNLVTLCIQIEVINLHDLNRFRITMSSPKILIRELKKKSDSNFTYVQKKVFKKKYLVIFHLLKYH